jgi:hypothetical protein
MRETLQRQWSPFEIDLATKIVEVVYSHRPNPVGKAHIALRIGLNRQTSADREYSILLIQDLMPLVVKICANAHPGYTILPKKSGLLFYTNNATAILLSEIPRIHSAVTKVIRIDDSFGALKENNDPLLQALAYRWQANKEFMLNLQATLAEVQDAYLEEA